MGVNILAGKTLERSCTEMYEEDQSKYAIVTDRRRALPLVWDGLKPVQRRILYATYKEGMRPGKLEKSASLTGEVMKNYHPHGDTYSSVVTMAAWYKNKLPLIYGHGNWGNIMGDGAASSRYTECCLSQFGYDVLFEELDQSKNIVDWLDTYKRNGMKEPEYLPVKAPVLLVNGTMGIGVGLAVNIPSHNFGEVVDATIALLHNPYQNITLIPDLCQPCELIDCDWSEISNTGSGSFKVRGVIDTIQDKQGNYVLHVRSLPDGVSTTSVYEKILAMIDAKQMPMIKDILNSLDKNGLPDIIIHLRPGSDPNFVKSVLYAKTEIQKSITVNFEAVASNGIDVQRFSYRDYLLTFIDQRMAIKFRLYCNKLQKAMTRYHYLDAFIRVLESGEIDNIIAMIKKSTKSDDDIAEYIIKMCKVTDIQAKYILNANLGKLSMAHLRKYKDEVKELRLNINHWMKVVSDDSSYIKAEIEQELLELKAKYASPRLCRVISKAEEENIPSGIFKIVITEKNFIRKVPDVDRVGVVRKDNPKFILRVDNTDNLLLFDNKGKVYNLPVSKISITDKNSMGTDVRILVRNLTSDIISVFSEPIFKKISASKNKHYLVVLTRNNTIKRLDIEDFLNVGPSGLLYSKIKQEDEVVSIALAAHNLDIVMCSDQKALRCRVADIPLLKRNASGPKAMDTEEPIEGMTVIYPDANYIVALTRNGKLNKFDINLLQCHARARKGSNVLKLDSNDQIFGIYAVNDSDMIRIVTTEAVEEIPVAEIKLKSPIAAGKRMGKASGVIIKADVVR